MLKHAFVSLFEPALCLRSESLVLATVTLPINPVATGNRELILLTIFWYGILHCLKIWRLTLCQYRIAQYLVWWNFGIFVRKLPLGSLICKLSAEIFSDEVVMYFTHPSPVNFPYKMYILWTMIFSWSANSEGGHYGWTEILEILVYETSDEYKTFVHPDLWYVFYECL